MAKPFCFIWCIVFAMQSVSARPINGTIVEQKCEVVTKGNLSYVDCKLPKDFDIKLLRLDFRLEFTEKNSPQIKPELAYACFWNDSVSEKPQCLGSKGYSIHQLSKGSLKITVPQTGLTTKDYKCYTKGGYISHKSCCEVQTTTLKPQLATSPKPAWKHDGTEVINTPEDKHKAPPKPEDQNKDNTDENKINLTTVIITAIVAGTVIIIVFVVCVLLILRHHREDTSNRDLHHDQTQILLQAPRPVDDDEGENQLNVETRNSNITHLRDYNSAHNATLQQNLFNRQSYSLLTQPSGTIDLKRDRSHAPSPTEHQQQLDQTLSGDNVRTLSTQELFRFIQQKESHQELPSSFTREPPTTNLAVSVDDPTWSQQHNREKRQGQRGGLKPPVPPKPTIVV